MEMAFCDRSLRCHNYDNGIEQNEQELNLGLAAKHCRWQTCQLVVGQRPGDITFHRRMETMHAQEHKLSQRHKQCIWQRSQLIAAKRPVEPMMDARDTSMRTYRCSRFGFLSNRPAGIDCSLQSCR